MSCANDGESLVVENHETREARKLANIVILNQLNSRIKNEPAADLLLVLNQQVASYSQLVASIAETTVPSPSGRSLESFDVETVSGSKETKLPLVSTEEPIKILHPLSHEISALLSPSLEYDWAIVPSDHFPSEAVASLNELIQGGEVLHQLYGTYVISIGPRYVVKISTSGDLDQITNLQYIHDNAPKVPAPQCLGTIANGRRNYFFMSRAPGSTLESVWSILSVSAKVSIRNQLNSLLRYLRSISPESQQERILIGSFVSGVCKDTRRGEHVASGPVQNEKEFNEFLCSKPGRTTTTWIKTVCSSMGYNHRIVMTHGDLHPRNIMVCWERDENDMMLEDTVRVSSILDWETAGWYPEYWEFVKAMHTADSRGPLRDWINYLPTEAIGNFVVEYSIDCLIDRWHG
ncbi:kinase-like protein [Xylariaceae sp. AK1471]|nr:kinase-like protein [Xylariaceae sp. AK1471]